MNTPAMRASLARSANLGRQAAFLSIAATIYFLCASLAAHLAKPQLDLFTDYLGDYAIGPHGWIYGSAFWAAFIGTLALTAALCRLAPRTSVARVGLALMIVVALTFPIEYFFHTDILAPGGAPTTTSGEVHLIAAMIEWTLFPLSALLLTLSLRRDPYWARAYRGLLGLALLSIALLAGLWIVIVLKAPFDGLADKLFFLSRNLWALLAGLIALGAADPQRSAPR